MPPSLTPATMHNIAIRILAPLLFVATALGMVGQGTRWMPLWIANVGARISLTEIATAQLVVGILIATAVTLALCGGRLKTIAVRVALVAYAFCCVATLASLLARSSTVGNLPLLMPTIALCAAMGINLVLDRTKRVDSRHHNRSGVWFGAGILGIWVLSLGLAARVPIAMNSTLRTDARGIESVSLDYVQWQGRTLPDTGLSRLLPHLTALTLEGRSIIILYSPECGHCREVFDQYFATPRPDVKVFAVEIPPPPDSIALSGDNLGPMPCADCQRLSLPLGKHYILKPPTVLVVDNGRVVCATDSDWKSCLGEPTAPVIAPPGQP
ncbi:MAG: hypothetical protein EXS01_04240 [Phycisphaerales bacterium]|nr:hypothetical protein [Phycisphaerales bacterium]